MAVPFDWVVYPGAYHAFDRVRPEKYDTSATSDARNRLRRFLKAQFE